MQEELKKLEEKFRNLAPGSFKHCQNVENLCESVSLQLKIDTNTIDNLKLAARFHDIGKINSPEYFIENVDGKNIHDNLEPKVSYNIITRHVGDSIVILLNSGFDPETLKIISQHHGTTILKCFYKKAQEENPEVVDDLYRYKCNRPKSLESAILMICDSVEATARALNANNGLSSTDDRKKVVDSTVKRLMDDDQLDDIRVGDLKLIKRKLYSELEKIYHKREIYGDEKTVGEIKDGDIEIE